jgi:Carboxypeptidase regulatory-like domain/TonB dependent receptor
MLRTTVLALLLCPAFLLAQTDTGSLSGIITDPASAAINRASVQLRNAATGATRTTLSATDGSYRFTLLAPGKYEITVEAAGFKKFVDASVHLQVAQQSQLDIPMQLGSTSESIQVEAAVSMLNTESVAQGTVISQEKIESLPLNGRQFIQLALLVPGANSGGRAVQQNAVRLNQVGGFSSSGGRTNNNAFLLDGAINTDPDYNAISYVPIIDSLAEFQVQTAQFSAQYGRASGSQINVVTRSGSNDLHGGAWDFLRNQALDSRPFNSITSSLPRNQRNQFGGTLGGPVLKDRLFFFGAFEALRLRQAGVNLTTTAVPTALERTGDFSAMTPAVYDPNSTVTTGSTSVRQPFPGNGIPVDRINPQTLAAMAAMPLPNAGGSNYVNNSGLLSQNNNNYSIRMDYVASQRVSLFGRYSISDENDTVPDVVPLRDQISAIRPQNAAIGSTQMLSSSKVNEVRLGFNRLKFVNGLPEPLFQVGGQSVNLPRFLPSGYSAMGGAGSFTGTLGGGTVQARNNTYQIYDNFCWQRGRHSLKFGAEAMQINYDRYESPNPLGTFNFNTGYTSRTASNDGTGSALASMLLGIPNQASRSIGPKSLTARQLASGFYAQDDFRIRANLTLNIGVRYELAPPMHDLHHQLSSIDFSKVPSPQAIFASGPLATYKPTLFVCGQGGYPDGCAYTDHNNVSPRLGFAWTPFKKTVIRAGAGIFYATTDNNGLYQMAITLPNNISQSLTPNAFIPSIFNFNPFGGAVVGPVAVTQPAIDLHQRTSYAPQWSFSIQRELARDLAVEAGYLGTLGVKLQQNVQPNNSQPGSATVDPRRPYGGLIYDAGVVFPSYITVQGTSVPVTQVNIYQMSAQSNYHALYARLEKRYARGLSLLSSYTFSKAITNAPQYRNAGGANGSENSPPQDSYNLRAERGLASFDVRQHWVNSLVYTLPWKNAVLKGWQLSTILTLQDGFPFTINLAGDTAGIGGGTGGILIRANPTGTSYQLARDQKSTARWFNPAAFVAPPAFQFGALGRNTVIGPGMVNLDTGVSRTFRIVERVNLQLRGEFFNTVNHPNFNLVGRIINQPNFGAVLSQFDPRQVQLAAKLAW